MVESIGIFGAKNSPFLINAIKTPTAIKATAETITIAAMAPPFKPLEELFFL